MKFVSIGKKLFDCYEVKFPIENELTIIHGLNGTGKTQTLEAVRDYFIEQGENVLYFDSVRTFDITKEEVYAIETYYRMMDEEETDIFKKHNIEFHDFDLEMAYENRINGGNMQMINFICKIVRAPEDTIVMIDTPEVSLHALKRRSFISDIMTFKNIKKLIIVTHSPEIIGDLFSYQGHRESAIDIKHCVNLRGEQNG